MQRELARIHDDPAVGPRARVRIRLGPKTCVGDLVLTLELRANESVDPSRKLFAVRFAPARAALAEESTSETSSAPPWRARS